MIHRLLTHLRGNAVAYVALFVALGGTSYAATALPRGSVGTKQLRNGSVTPNKLNAGSFAGHILFTAQVNSFGRVLSSHPSGASTYGWDSNPNNLPDGGLITWHRPIPKGCFAVSNPPGLPAGTIEPVSSSAETVAGSVKDAYVRVFVSAPVGTQVAVICP